MMGLPVTRSTSGAQERTLAGGPTPEATTFNVGEKCRLSSYLVANHHNRYNHFKNNDDKDVSPVVAAYFHFFFFRIKNSTDRS